MEYVDENTIIKRPEPKLNRPDDANLLHKGIIYDVCQWEQKLFDGSTTTA
jgi:hypothetical protein